MKTNQIIYWTTTGIITAMMLFSGISYLTNDELKAAFTTMGFPEFFRVELGLAKILGSLVLIIPAIPLLLRQFAYFGFALTFLSATILHISINDTWSAIAAPIIFFGILTVSFVYFHKSKTALAR
jgi:hypothetical protein